MFLPMASLEYHAGWATGSDIILKPHEAAADTKLPPVERKQIIGSWWELTTGHAEFVRDRNIHKGGGALAALRGKVSSLQCAFASYVVKRCKEMERGKQMTRMFCHQFNGSHSRLRRNSDSDCFLQKELHIADQQHPTTLTGVWLTHICFLEAHQRMDLKQQTRWAAAHVDRH